MTLVEMYVCIYHFFHLRLSQLWLLFGPWNMASLSSGQTLNIHYGRDVSQPVNHDSCVRLVISLNAAFAAVVAVLVTIRLVVRWKIVGRIGPDDSGLSSLMGKTTLTEAVLMVLAAFFFVGLCATCIVGMCENAENRMSSNVAQLQRSDLVVIRGI
jgi:hypothetical protein